jgi:multiple sugar transport system substrate-binding protein
MRLSFGRRTAAANLAVAAAIVLAAAGCSSSSSSPSASSTSSSSGKINLTFWSWVPNINKVTALWNASHPGIHVTATETVAGDPEMTKLLTAAKASNAPDVAQVEYQTVPTFVTSNYLADISSYDASLSSDFSPGIWKQVTLGTSALYGVPQDAAPMALFYRTDLFKKYGLTVPATWAQFATEAARLHKLNPKAYLGTFSTEDPGEFAGLTQQAGAQWWTTHGSSWTVNIDSTASQQVASYWGGLVASGVINNQPQWTPAWLKGMNDGTYAAWVSAVWAPGDLVTDSAANAGKWAMAPLPQWTAGADSTGNWGGSSTAVMADSKHKQAAAQFAAWLNTNESSVSALVTDGGIYPADIAAQTGGALSKAPAYFSNQPDFYTLASQIAAHTAGPTWGPDVNVAYSEFTDAFQPVVTAKSSFAPPLATLQQTVISDMKKSGFTVTPG